MHVEFEVSHTSKDHETDSYSFGRLLDRDIFLCLAEIAFVLIPLAALLAFGMLTMLLLGFDIILSLYEISWIEICLILASIVLQTP